MPNFFTDNKDLVFSLDNIDLVEAVELREKGYTEAEKHDTAPVDYADAMDNFKRVAEVIGGICGDNIEPRSRTIDQEGPHFEDGVVTYHPLTQKNLADLVASDVCGVMLPHQYGGLNFPVSVYAMLTEMVSRADGSLQNLFGLQDIAETICEFGTDEMKDEFLPRFACGEADGAMDLTEPDSGSDLGSVRLRAWQDEKTGQWYLNGMKRFITNGCAKVHLVLARTEDGSTDARGLSMFVCEMGPNLIVRRIEDKLGIHGVATCELQYNDVPAQLCGKRRFGLSRYVMSLMNGARVAISAQALGIGEAAYRDALKYAGEREQFKKAIDKFPAIYDMLTKMKVKLQASRCLLYETTRTVDLRNGWNHFIEHAEKGTATKEELDANKYYKKLAAVQTPMCKALCTEVANQVAYDSIQIHGGTGFMRDFNAERFYRDARITNIYEGTTQLQVVAAIGGVIQRINDKSIAEMQALPFNSKLKRLQKKLDKMYKKHLESVKLVADKKDRNYHDLMARSLVDNETYVFVGYLMLRDAMKDAERENLAERYILDAIPEFEKRYVTIMSDDFTLIDNHRDIIDY